MQRVFERLAAALSASAAGGDRTQTAAAAAVAPKLGPSKGGGAAGST